MGSDALALEALLLSRAYLYELLHKALGGEPSPELLELLCGEAALDALDEYARAGDAIVSFGDFASKRLKSRLGDGEYLELAKDEYVRLFFGFDSKAASPCESVYRSEAKAHFTAKTLAVREAYRAEGLIPAKYPRVPDDHISLECGFMALMSQKSLEAFGAGDAGTLAETLARQRSFLEAHLTQWVPTYASEVRKKKTAVLYPQVVTMAEAFFAADLTFAGEALAWALEASGEGKPCDYAYSDGAAKARERFAEFEASLNRLRALRLRGLEDNELCEI